MMKKETNFNFFEQEKIIHGEYSPENIINEKELLSCKDCKFFNLDCIEIGKKSSDKTCNKFEWW
jgi:hypothetical protein